MRRIIMTKGLPASGKSTFAKELLEKEPGQWKRVNKDEIRSMLDNGKWSKDNEKFVLKIRDALINAAMYEKKNVIVDDTNLAPKHEEAIRAIIKYHNQVEEYNKTNNFYELEIKDFTNVPLEECIKRDQKRPNYVGEKVIKQMYRQFLQPPPSAIPLIPGAPDAIICDIDGTLALFGDANPYDRDFSKDEVNTPVRDILLAFNNALTIILLSGRDGKHREATEDWLSHWGIPHNELYMRTAGDNRKDFLIKKELYDKHIQGKYNVRFILDDRDQVVELWRSMGLTCLQVAEGDF